MGVGVLTTYPQIANIAGIHGLLVYTIAGAIPIFLFSVFTPMIRKKCPEGFVLTEWCFQRFGKITGLYLSLFTLFTMFLYMISELTAIHDAIEALTGLNATPCVIIECIFTTIYTALGGFKVSFKTDVIQTCFVLVTLIIAVIAYATEIHIDHELKQETYHQLTGSNKLGWMLLYILNVAIITNDAFLSGFWLRAFAAKSDKDLIVGTSIAAVTCCIICTLSGLPGILGVWTGDLVIGDENGYNAFYILCAKMDKWVIGIVLIFAVSISTCTFDSLLSATTSSISNDIFRNKVNMLWVRFLVVLIMIPSLVVTLKCSANVLQVYLIADLVSASIIPVMFLGLWGKLYFLRGLDVMFGGLGALVAVFVYGCIYYDSAREGGRLLLIWNGLYDDSDWGPFGAFVVAPVFGILLGFLCAGFRIGVSYLHSKSTGKPFTALDKPVESNNEDESFEHHFSNVGDDDNKANKSVDSSA
ncbi:unnamed protein product [Ambrosiozyma monospora]|uniref:Unnamed protein product n=1 Tax=Ambrosiozyma monospora TaxID=43982 RepID=A0ACB5SUW6_AMBMO|nr:unnamed protein product [Ambrosiozyma monospora]